MDAPDPKPSVRARKGVMNVEAIAAAENSQLAALAFGAEGYISDLGGRRTPEGLEVLYARSRVVMAARAFALQALDQVFVSLRDVEAFRGDAEIGRQFGYSGKMCVVPRQIEIANAVFSFGPRIAPMKRKVGSEDHRSAIAARRFVIYICK